MNMAFKEAVELLKKDASQAMYSDALDIILAAIEKQPKTADGVMIYPGLEVYFKELPGIEKYDKAVIFSIRPFDCMVDVHFPNAPNWRYNLYRFSFNELYSTAAARDAAEIEGEK